jgi:hypothetical protein
MKHLYGSIVAASLSLIISNGIRAQNNLILATPLSATPGSNNTYIGSAAGAQVSSARNNVFIGQNAGTLNGGIANTLIGVVAGLRTTGNENTYLGYYAGYSLSGNQNVAIGVNAGFGGGLGSDLERSKGSYNIYVGASAGYKGYTNNSNHNVLIGDSAGYNNIVPGNVMLGSKAGYTNQTGQKSTFLGYQSGFNAVADSNTFVGYQAGYTTTTGTGNTFFGTASGKGNSTGNHNTFVGNGAGPGSANTDDNVYIGYNTGNHANGSRNTFLGANADAIAQNLHNATAIGAGAQVAVSNAVSLGKDANVGIGTSAPTTRLEVNSGTDHESGVRLSRMTADSPTQLTTTEKVLTVNKTGQLILAQAGRFSVKTEADWSDKVFAADYKLKSLHEVAHYIHQYKHLPGVPSAEEVVKQGVNIGKMQATLLEKVEELTLYSIQLKKISQQQQAEIHELKQLVRQLAKRR